MGRSRMKTVVMVLFITIAFLPGYLCLKLLRVSVPQYKSVGEMASLQCLFDLENDHLYSVTWYKDHDEFYRYVQRSNPPQMIFKLDGFNVDQYTSDSQNVILKDINLQASGTYKCEVSAEKPNFSSKSGEAHMEVISLPEADPEITGQEKVYQIGDIVNLNCTSDKSYPPARLKWYVNDEQILPDYEAEVRSHGLVISVIGLKLQVTPQYFQYGKMKIKCISTITTGRDVVMERATPLFDNRETLFLVMGASSAQGSIVMIFVTALFCILFNIMNH